MRKPGRPPKVKLDQPQAPVVTLKKEIIITNKPSANKSLLEVGLEMARGLLKMYTESKIAIGFKYRACDQFREGAEYKAMLSREIGRIEATERLIKEFEELLK